ncbi:hypothetical protein [Actinorugispora endophytica]|uniref:Uncharacterized protein n=1 Tax=Actinorugispora endophytica TaxID=1605990 RepID=A0A4R6UUM8_9ACTN|nr:hypothetical protein [Actinorugispora endophytica]TDQ49966.1 hypothetical protein EV190_11410 [Actinorugispora endophytica]
MKRRNPSRPPRRKRSLGPLLRLALPVVATALTLGSLLVNTMTGGTTASWVLTGVSAVVCAGAWWLHHLHHAASRSRRKGHRRAGGAHDAEPS